jgi:colicin import membrane protein
MKAALAAWGAQSNLFHQGIANQTNDPEVIAATMAHPGIVLKRPVGSDRPFREHAELPSYLSEKTVTRTENRRKKHKKALRKVDDQAAQKPAALEKAERQRENERRKEEARRTKQQERRQRAIARAEAALEKAKREHDKRVSAIESEQAAIDRRSEGELSRWEKQKARLDSGGRTFASNGRRGRLSCNLV